MSPTKPDFRGDGGYGQAGCLLAVVGAAAGGLVSLPLQLWFEPALPPISDALPFLQLGGIAVLALIAGLVAMSAASGVIERVPALWSRADVVYVAAFVPAVVTVPVAIYVPVVGDLAWLLVGVAVILVYAPPVVFGALRRFSRGDWPLRAKGPAPDAVLHKPARALAAASVAPPASDAPGDIIDHGLRRLAAGDGEFAVFAVPGERNAYVQVSVLPGARGLYGETVSSEYLAGEPLDEEDHLTPETLGWTLAEPGSGANHSREWTEWTDSARAKVVEDLLATLMLLFDLAPDGSLDVTVGD
jgi:hypothetical protein